MEVAKPSLKRVLTLSLVTFYGLGSIIGAGIYALIGAVAHEAKFFTTFSFLIAGLLALFTAATYAELSSRFPESAGASLYVSKAFKITWLSGLIGWLVVSTGIISSGALVHGLINYLQLYSSLPTGLLIPIIVILLGGITVCGITESALTIFLMTLLEIFGLLLIIWYGKHNFSNIITDTVKYVPGFQLDQWTAIFSGAFLAFYAFIGFEDMVNLAEETKNPAKTMPRAILLAASFSIVLYLIVSYITVASLSEANFRNNKTLLPLIIEQQGHSTVLFSLIAMFSIANGIIVNIIMASRLIYGMTKLHTSPKIFSLIYNKTQIPITSTLAVMMTVILAAYLLPIQTLAKITSLIMLLIFTVMHLSLIKVKLHSQVNQKYFSVPMILPIVGLILSFGFLIFSLLLQLKLMGA